MKPFRPAMVVWLLMASQALAQHPIRLKTRVLTPEGGAPVRLAKLAERTHFLVQFRSYPDAGVRSSLTRRGIRVLEYIPDNGLMVSSGPSADLSGLDMGWAGPLGASDKLSPRLAASSTGSFVVIFHKDVVMEEAPRLVQAHRLDVVPNPHLLRHHLLVVGSYQRVAELAASDAVAYVLPGSIDLLTGAPVQGCGGAIAEAGEIGEYALMGSGWSKDAGGMASLQYDFVSMSGKLSEAVLRGEVERAFREWERYAPIRLTEGQQSDAARTIAIRFASLAHGDSYPFDGPGGALGHTFYPAPKNAEPIAGDMHLDADEAWAVASGIDLYTVVLHETGHALGLGHSDVPGSVMYPYYRLASGLTADDIGGLQELYGSPETAVTEPTLPPPSPETPVEPSMPALPPPAPEAPVIPEAPPAPAPSDDRTPPSLRIVSPARTILSTVAASISVSGTAADDTGVALVEWSTSNGDQGVASGTAAWSASVPLLVGTNVVTVRAYDASGNSSWRAFTAVRR